MIAGHSVMWWPYKEMCWGLGGFSFAKFTMKALLLVAVVSGVFMVTFAEEATANHTGEIRNSPIIYYPTYYPVNREYFGCFVEMRG